MGEASGGVLSWEDYIYVLDYYHRNDVVSVSLLGGEPTLHPGAVEMVDYALRRNFEVRMFTSGVMPNSVRERLGKLISRLRPECKLHFIVNVNHPRYTPESQRHAQEAFLSLAGPRASISFNIFEPNFELDFAFDLIQRFDLHQNIRLGLTHPIAGGQKNTHLGPPAYADVASALDSHVDQFIRNRVSIGLDCGFPFCMFTAEQLGRLVSVRATFHWMCGPVVDIGPDLAIWPCFPLSHLRRKTLYDFARLNDIVDWMKQQIHSERAGCQGIYLECDDCHFRSTQMCGGGCVAYSLLRGEDA
jgi:radical SAM protein with 4Fe4S-binding SPASM domain